MLNACTVVVQVTNNHAQAVQHPFMMSVSLSQKRKHRWHCWYPALRVRTWLCLPLEALGEELISKLIQILDSSQCHAAITWRFSASGSHLHLKGLFVASSKSAVEGWQVLFPLVIFLAPLFPHFTCLSLLWHLPSDSSQRNFSAFNNSCD